MDHDINTVPRPETSGMAIASLVLGVSSFLCWVFAGIPAIILGALAIGKIDRSGGQITGRGMAIAGITTGAISTLLIIPAILVALLLPAIQAAREAARRNIAMNNVKQVLLALHNYHDIHGSFPPAGGIGDGANSQLSWRVHILPYLEQQALYDQFHLDEAWDSPHNRALIAQMPAAYKDPADSLPPGETPYLAVTGPQTGFDNPDVGTKMQDFSDGLSNTIMVVEADQGVEWTKPDDWRFNPNNPSAGLGTKRRIGFLAGFGDGSVQFINDSTDVETIKAMMTRDGREVIEQW